MFAAFVDEGLAGAFDAAFDRVHRAAQSFGDVLVGQLFDFAQGQNFAVFFRQRRE